MTKKYDVIVIGSGASGSNAAYGCREAGMNVAVIDQSPFGGTCALRGCNPKKVLHGVADIAESVRNMNKVLHGKVDIDWQRLIEFKKTFIEKIPEQSEKGFEDYGIEVFKGTAKFTGEKSIIINDIEMSADYIVLAAGSIPRKLDFPGNEFLTTSNIFMENTHLPDEIIFIGGGFISFELAHISARSGAKVKIIHRSGNPLKKFDQDLIEILLEITSSAGIEFIPDTQPVSIKQKGKRLLIDCGKESYTCDMAVHGAGRVPNTKMLDLKKAGVKEEHGILVNKYLQSISNPRVYAIGDAASLGQPLTPVVSMQGKIAAYNIINGNSKSLDYSLVPNVVFSIPPMGRVGLTEKEVIERGLDYRAKIVDTSKWYNIRRLGFKKTGFKVLIDKKTDQIVGVHILGPGVEEVLDFFMLVMKTGLTAGDIKDLMFSYPSRTYDIKSMI